MNTTTTPAAYTLHKTVKKNGSFLYQVKDAAGNVVSDRTSTREYAACTVDGDYYFGRVDLIGKGDHGKSIKFNSMYTNSIDEFGKWVRLNEPNKKRLEELNTIAYLVSE